MKKKRFVKKNHICFDVIKKNKISVKKMSNMFLCKLNNNNKSDFIKKNQICCWKIKKK